MRTASVTTSPRLASGGKMAAAMTTTFSELGLPRGTVTEAIGFVAATSSRLAAIEVVGDEASRSGADPRSPRSRRLR